VHRNAFFYRKYIRYFSGETIPPVASPGFVARRGKDGNYVIGTDGGLHGRVQQLVDD